MTKTYRQIVSELPAEQQAKEVQNINAERKLLIWSAVISYVSIVITAVILVVSVT